MRDSKDVQGQAVDIENNKNAKNQKWRIVYLDEMEKTRTKGINKDYGFEINRPFYFVS